MSDEDDLSRPGLSGQRSYSGEQIVNSGSLRNVLQVLSAAFARRSFECTQLRLSSHVRSELQRANTALLHHREMQSAQSWSDEILEKTRVMERTARVDRHERSAPRTLDENHHRLGLRIMGNVDVDGATGLMNPILGPLTGSWRGHHAQ